MLVAVLISIKWFKIQQFSLVSLEVSYDYFMFCLNEMFSIILWECRRVKCNPFSQFWVTSNYY